VLKTSVNNISSILKFPPLHFLVKLHLLFQKLK